MRYAILALVLAGCAGGGGPTEELWHPQGWYLDVDLSGEPELASLTPEEFDDFEDDVRLEVYRIFAPTDVVFTPGPAYVQYQDPLLRGYAFLLGMSGETHDELLFICVFGGVYYDCRYADPDIRSAVAPAHWVLLAAEAAGLSRDDKVHAVALMLANRIGVAYGLEESGAGTPMDDPETLAPGERRAFSQSQIDAMFAAFCRGDGCD